MRAMRTLLLVGLTLLSLSCGDDGLSPDWNVERQRAQARWDALGLTHYTVEARLLCFCAPGLGSWHELTVRDGHVVASRLVDFSPPGTALPPGAFFTVDEMFEYIDSWFVGRAGAQRGERFSATFDAATGLPSTVTFEVPPERSSGGMTYQYRALTPQ